MPNDSTVVNDSGIPLDQVTAYLNKEGTDITYGELKMRAEKTALEGARAYAANLGPEERQHVARSVDRALRRAYPKIAKGKYSKKLCDNFHTDLLLWEALKSYVS